MSPIRASAACPWADIGRGCGDYRGTEALGVLPLPVRSFSRATSLPALYGDLKTLFPDVVSPGLGVLGAWRDPGVRHLGLTRQDLGRCTVTAIHSRPCMRSCLRASQGAVFGPLEALPPSGAPRVAGNRETL